MALQDKFWVKVGSPTDAGCLPWLGAKTRGGYGRMRIKGKYRYAHHLALEMAGFERNGAEVAMHSCNNPSCVAVAHLSWGTQKENVQQSLREGRSPHTGRVAGERNGNAKLTAADVVAIRASDIGPSELARSYGVSPSLICAIRARRSWGHV